MSYYIPSLRIVTKENVTKGDPLTAFMGLWYKAQSTVWRVLATSRGTFNGFLLLPEGTDTTNEVEE